ncbi:hypothetical protein NQ315_014399 [Exocentrus adspersus]|uniref:Retrotransposon gag domain-containing protein n=1 Tax=Exocentrus adspersus TaxID=1586481 RepID=A0AAV8VFY2_9CUCU|nr:hypothetical protein NQ315_014399 [Exocentrus adspersus]
MPAKSSGKYEKEYAIFCEWRKTYNVVQTVNENIMLAYFLDVDRSAVLPRKRLREFTGFAFEEHSEEFEQKVKYANDNFSISDLTSFANILGIDYDKGKDELIVTICSSLTNLRILQEESEEDREEEGEEEDEEPVTQKEQNRILSVSTPNTSQSTPLPQFSMNFKDVEDSLRKFDGTESYPVEKWIEDVEDMSILMRWSELHLFIYAKKSLSGLAKLFIQGERGIKSWKSLKNALKEEYSLKLNSAQLQKRLTDRRLKKGESVQEYFLVMRELASHGDIENQALFQYVIDGIPDSYTNKIVLYGAKTISDFK